jgi:hypothetical protein
MTTSSTSSFELTRDGLFRRAFQLAGLLEASQQPTGDDISMATDLLSMEIQALQSIGVVVTQVERATLALVAGTSEYTLDSDTLDVVVGPDNQVGTIYSVAGGAETPVTAMSRMDWIAAQTKASQSTPTLAFIERTMTAVKVVFWMTPNAALTFRYAKIRLPRDNDTGAVTMDLARRWQKALCFSMAYQIALAKNAPLQRVKMLEDRADREKSIATASDVEKGHMQLMPYQGSGGYR